MTKAERFRGCIIGGAIGDAWGSGFENQFEEETDTFYLIGKPKVVMPTWGITDDTQLTLATIEALINNDQLTPESVAKQFLVHYKRRTLKGLGASTMMSLKALNAGGHWSQAGRRGEYAAGNGAAMRIAALAFREDVSYSLIQDICTITHNNDEAYIGAKSVVIAIREILNGNWDGTSNLIELIVDQIPDTRIKDRLIEIKDINSLEEIGKKGSGGYVVDSVPLAIAAANKVRHLGIEAMYTQLIAIGGDTDTNCSIAGQIAGTHLGLKQIPHHLINNLKNISEYQRIKTTIDQLVKKEEWL